ncbi:protein-export chaperone SecB [Spiribacter vilamensis]|uniref:Preprotein translocase subunit SecB n=1 Tax=Spiribacter vilamensis TaxID=531306 RepID=A0A4Q8D1B5_9GAMM|nr:protein-export chaperone SecB [Spiribacter vilamensis]RZU99092.1 preprotein translocase subunit SecB [Spiribacter vilamensis]TVO61911.1 hypothetical protein FPL09_07345 [Spiribacter vilamensis]
MTPELQFEHYFFKRLLVDTRLPDGGQALDFEYPLEVSTAIELYPLLGDENRFQLRLIIERDAADLPPGAYQVEVEVYGIFRASGDQSQADKEKAVRLTGAPILYDAAREHLLAVTGRGPWPALMLPIASFVPEGSDKST